jgi:hypothetical protein
VFHLAVSSVPNVPPPCNCEWIHWWISKGVIPGAGGIKAGDQSVATFAHGEETAVDSWSLCVWVSVNCTRSLTDLQRERYTSSYLCPALSRANWRFHLRTVQPVASRYTDWAIPAHERHVLILNTCTRQLVACGCEVLAALSAKTAVFPDTILYDSVVRDRRCAENCRLGLVSLKREDESHRFYPKADT